MSASTSDNIPEPGDSGAAKDRTANGGHRKGATKGALALGAIGVVFGDIGTSPLYAFRETFSAQRDYSIPVDALHIYGVVSLIFWSMLLVVAIQYVTILMRADNNGQGGSLALVALLSRRMKRGPMGMARRASRRLCNFAVLRRQHDHTGDFRPLRG